MFKETNDGQTHYFNDGCGMPEHNQPDLSVILNAKKAGNETDKTLDSAKKLAKLMKPKPLNQYYEACNALLLAFLKKYYTDKDNPIEDIDYCWIGDQVGGVVGINDEFWSMDDIVTAMEIRPTQKQLFDWYWYQIDEQMENKSPINLENYLKMKK